NGQGSGLKGFKVLPRGAGSQGRQQAKVQLLCGNQQALPFGFPGRGTEAIDQGLGRRLTGKG
ncbi:MAG: hypothetical protein EBQ88_01540, partial [Betaproteobacteria bacterium]|nr:hypothetical protein [Betaproteobacteria bacterium]